MTVEDVMVDIEVVEIGFTIVVPLEVVIEDDELRVVLLPISVALVVDEVVWPSEVLVYETVHVETVPLAELVGGGGTAVVLLTVLVIVVRPPPTTAV